MSWRRHRPSRQVVHDRHQKNDSQRQAGADEAASEGVRAIGSYRIHLKSEKPQVVP